MDFGGVVLGPGSQVGQFRIEQEIGRGAMGVVYLAHDSKLDRKVAIKSLPIEIMADSKAKSRFSREARMLASVNHPNIATIHDVVEEAEGTGYLVLEYVPGQTLDKRIASGRLTLEESLSIAIQITEAVAAAHEHNVIHRDLKPGNIKITPEGTVKVLDFGLARAIGGKAVDVQRTVTEPGRVIGTPAYMSPEQARGDPADKRSDTWSFGCVLFEMLTTAAPFKGDTVSDTLANILQTEPDWHALPDNTPASIRFVLRRCLMKDPRQRFQNIADVGIQISDTLAGSGDTPVASTSRPCPLRIPGLGRMMVLAVVCMVLGALVATVTVWSLQQPIPLPLSHFPIGLPPNQMLASDRADIAVSPNGKHLVYGAQVGGVCWLYLRERDQSISKLLPGTKGAHNPFFSPDGQSIGFGDGDKLMTLSLNGGRPKALCNASDLIGGCWGADGMIYFTPSATSGVWRIAADGGAPEVLTSPKSDEGEFCHWWPEVLPDGEAILFTIWRSDLDDFSIAVLELSTGHWRTVLLGGAHARYSPTGHLLYGQAGALWAAPFDVENLRLGKPRRPVLESINQSMFNGCVPFCFSDDGMLYYVRGGLWLARHNLVWVNRLGEVVESLALPPKAYIHPRLSPDERQLAFTIFEGGNYHIWVYDLPSGPTTQLTSGNWDFLPLWMPPDGHRVAFSSFRAGPGNVYWLPADGSLPAEPLVEGPMDQIASCWAPDGRAVLFDELNHDSGNDIGILCVEDSNTPRLLLQEKQHESHGVFSPDGRWIAYQSDREGTEEVYLMSYPGLLTKKISTGGGRNPVWSKDGKDLFYRVGNKMVAASIETEPELKVTGSDVLFDGRLLATDFWASNYDVSRDGQRFLMVEEDEEQPSANQLVVVLNWFEKLERLVPVTRN
jgi:serine/threonine-protein kinase